MIENGIKPVYVFEGKPPSMKAGELAKRSDRRIESTKELAKAEAEEDLEAIEKFSKRLVKVTPAHNEDCRQLLNLMGVPFVNVSSCNKSLSFSTNLSFKIIFLLSI